MNSKFLDTLHEQNTEILVQLHELRVIIKAVDTLGMSSLADKLWFIYEGINSSNKQILDAYGSAPVVSELQRRISRDCAIDEVDELMDCIHSDHTFEDLDKHTPADMQTTTGSTIAWLMHRCHQAETIMQRLKDATNPLMEVSERELHRTRVAAENHFRDAAKMVESK